MDKKLYLIDLDCYGRADEKQKEKVKATYCFDLDHLPMEGLQKEFRAFIEERSRQYALATMIQERVVQFTDEPTGNLDRKTSAEVLGLIKRTSAELHQTVVMITHNNDIARLADRIIRIEDGKIVD